MLGITKEATDSDIRKAYKRLALQLHPDKNKAPGADEGFKAIGNAVATLTDEKKRKMYDLYGKDEFNTGGSGGGMRSRQGHQQEFGFNRGFEADVTADELFNMFFGGGFGQQQNVFTRTRRFHRAEAHQQTQDRQVFILIARCSIDIVRLSILLATTIKLLGIDQPAAHHLADYFVDDVVALHFRTDLQLAAHSVSDIY